MDDIFGGMFDLNGDGATDAIEAGLGYMILDDLLGDDETEDEDDDLDFDDHW